MPDGRARGPARSRDRRARRGRHVATPRCGGALRAPGCASRARGLPAHARRRAAALDRRVVRAAARGASSRRGSGGGDGRARSRSCSRCSARRLRLSPRLATAEAPTARRTLARQRRGHVEQDRGLGRRDVHGRAQGRLDPPGPPTPSPARPRPSRLELRTPQPPAGTRRRRSPAPHRYEAQVFALGERAGAPASRSATGWPTAARAKRRAGRSRSRSSRCSRRSEAEQKLADIRGPASVDDRPRVLGRARGPGGSCSRRSCYCRC